VAQDDLETVEKHLIFQSARFIIEMHYGASQLFLISNTLFMKQESQLVTYAADPVESMVDYIIMRQEDKAKVHNVKVIPNEECVPKQ